MGSTNSIGTNASCVGAVHELPTGYCTRAAIRYVTTVSARAETERARGAGLSPASRPAATTKITAVPASVTSSRRAGVATEWRSRPRRSRLSAPGVS